MKYMGSKNRIAKEILPIILKDRKPNQWYVEPFVGGANIIDKVDGNRIGGDSNLYLIQLLKKIQEGFDFRSLKIDKALYKQMKSNPIQYIESIVGFVGICCSYSGKWFGGYAGKTQTKEGIRDYQDEAIKNIEKQRPNLRDIIFKHNKYNELRLPSNSIIYCDPPYEGTTGYKNNFNHSEFWDWCREKKEEGHIIFISEYNAPEDFKEVWRKEVKSSLSANGKSGGSKQSIEKLFTL